MHRSPAMRRGQTHLFAYCSENLRITSKLFDSVSAARAERQTRIWMRRVMTWQVAWPRDLVPAESENANDAHRECTCGSSWLEGRRCHDPSPPQTRTRSNARGCCSNMHLTVVAVNDCVCGCEIWLWNHTSAPQPTAAQPTKLPAAGACTHCSTLHTV